MKKEIKKRRNIGYLFIIKNLLESKTSEELAGKLNSLIKEQGYENTKKLFFKVKEKNKDIPSVYYFVKEGKFVGYHINVKNIFIEDVVFFKNYEKYVKIHNELKEKERKKIEKLKYKIKETQDINFKYENIKEEDVNLLTDENYNSFFIFLQKMGIGKTVTDNSKISALVNEGKRYFIIKGMFNDKINTIVKYDVKNKKIAGFPSGIGYSLFGNFKSSSAFIFSDLFELEKYVESHNINENKMKEFFADNKFLVINFDVFIRVYPYKKNYGELLLNEKKIINFFKNSKIKNLNEIDKNIKFLVSELERINSKEKKNIIDF